MTAKILCLDLETSPITAHVWGLRDQNVGLNQIMAQPRVIGVAYKWLGAKTVQWKSEYHDSRSEMLTAIHAALDSADVAVHFNGNGFDIPWLMGEFAREDITPPSPFKNIDLYRVARKAFRFPSYKLQYVSTALGLEGKVSTGGHDLWVQCLEAEGEVQRRAWNRMRTYAKQDTALLEPLFYKLRPHFPTAVNFAIYEDDGEARCQKCGSDEFVGPKGTAYTAQGAFPQIYCWPERGGCGGWTRLTKAEKRISTAGVTR